ncbi:MATE family efflux transporter [Nonomuraea jiangxiensis]|uniref:Probable multidrug resistance protein NorM n=1 Tax=Nonomuraea jiangxiensis TaxID=633440 RepID=A0A1G9BYH0_9ACTN|nr:MATE family efflux transporter [Nonomuraea jiangxiensis]SDK44502.1 multidrug resistance protein, MATE family [Nonomuraea jiangxiensis]
MSDGRKLAALAGPIALTQLAQVALTTTDTVMLGLLGAEALAAGGLALVLFNQFRTMGVGLVTALGNQVAAALARGDGPDEVRGLVRAGFALATLAGLAGGLLMIGAGRLLGALGQSPAVAEQAAAMLLAMAPGLVPCLWFQVVRQLTVGARRPAALVWITVASIAANAALNWALLQVLGLPGIGLATSLVYALSFVALYLLTRRDPALTGMLAFGHARAERGTVGRLARLGVPIAATYGSEAGFFTVVALLMGTFGAPALAAHAAVNQLVYIVFQVSGIGLSHAASISVSGEAAVGRHDRAVRVGLLALGQGALVVSLVGAAYLLIPEVVLRPFLDPALPADRAALSVATGLLGVAALLQYFDSAQNIGVGLLRGLDDTRSGFTFTLVGYWLVGLPAAWLLGLAMDLGPSGVWWGLLIGLATTAVLLLVRFQRTAAARRAATPLPTT